MKNLTVLGSTGSIGTQTLEIVRAHKDELCIKAMTGNKNIELLKAQIREFSPELVCVYSRENAAVLEEWLHSAENTADLARIPKVVSGMDGLIDAAVYPASDTVVTAVVGMVGIRPTVEAVRAGKNIALANKETLVCAGKIIMSEAARCGINIYPVDSEHSAIFQCLNGEPRRAADKILLTASGGPFRGKKREELKNVSAADALKHPNWSMGKKVTIDSSTMANKGLEVIEARWLFNMPPSKIEVLVQPQSIVHSAVQFKDGAIIAQLGAPDMKLPIQYALFYPERPFLEGKRADLAALGSLTFEKPDMETFKALRLAYEAIDAGGTMPCVFNAANERAVRRFLAGDIAFLEIADSIEREMKAHKIIEDPQLDEIIKTGEDIIYA